MHYTHTKTNWCRLFLWSLTSCKQAPLTGCLLAADLLLTCLFIYLSITVAEKKGGKKHKLSMNCGWCSRKQCSGFSKQTITPLLFFFFFPFGADAVQGLLVGGTQGTMFSGGDKRQRICKDSSMGSSFCIEHTQNK